MCCKTNIEPIAYPYDSNVTLEYAAKPTSKHKKTRKVRMVYTVEWYRSIEHSINSMVKHLTSSWNMIPQLQ